jgi:hypothetical protein
VKAKPVTSTAVGCLNLFSCCYIDDFVGSSKTYHCAVASSPFRK